VNGRIATSWLLLSAAILINVVADFGFSFLTLQGTYYNGRFNDLLFLWGYMMFALAAYYHRKEL